MKWASLENIQFKLLIVLHLWKSHCFITKEKMFHNNKTDKLTKDSNKVTLYSHFLKPYSFITKEIFLAIIKRTSLQKIQARLLLCSHFWKPYSFITDEKMLCKKWNSLAYKWFWNKYTNTLFDMQCCITKEKKFVNNKMD